jgi:hypothetical protein
MNNNRKHPIFQFTRKNESKTPFQTPDNKKRRINETEIALRPMRKVCQGFPVVVHIVDIYPIEFIYFKLFKLFIHNGNPSHTGNLTTDHRRRGISPHAYLYPRYGFGPLKLRHPDQ